MATNTLNIKIENKLDTKVVEEFDTNYQVIDNNKTLDNKVVFGKLLVNIRTSNEIILTSILGNIEKTSCDNRYLYLETFDESIYKLLSRKDNLEILNSNLAKFTYLQVKPVLLKEEDKIDIIKILESKFKNNLKILE